MNVRVKPQNALHWERASIKKTDVSTIIFFGRRDIIKTQPKQPIPKTSLKKHLSYKCIRKKLPDLLLERQQIRVESFQVKY